jgi:tetratricopeptide (TPR) repeat protein
MTFAYGLTKEDCPDPLRGGQIVTGNKRGDVRQQLIRILRHHGLESMEAGDRLGGVLDEYLLRVEQEMRQSVSLPTEANVREWLRRLEVLVEENRLVELGEFTRWMNLAFGRGDGADDVPIDVRLHRWVGELHLGERNYDTAVRQLKLARLAAPRDIFILRPLGEAYLKRLLDMPGQDPDAELATIEQLLGMIEEIDPNAYIASPDAAALRSKFYRRAAHDLQGAVEVLTASLDRNPDSCYLADLLGQTLLEEGELNAAKAAFRRIPDILSRIDDRSIWAAASHATALVVAGDLDLARSKLADILAAGATMTQRASVALGIREVARRLNLRDDQTEALVSGYPGEPVL